MYYRILGTILIISHFTDSSKITREEYKMCNYGKSINLLNEIILNDLILVNELSMNIPCEL